MHYYNGTEANLRAVRDDSRQRILIIDDEESLIEMMSLTISKSLSAEIDSAGSKSECMELLENENYDIVVCDLNLPDNEGLDIVEEISIKYPEIPVIVITGMGYEELAAQSIKLGVYDYLPKNSDFMRKLPVSLTNAIDSNTANRALMWAQEELIRKSGEILSLYNITSIINLSNDYDSLSGNLLAGLSRFLGSKRSSGFILFYDDGRFKIHNANDESEIILNSFLSDKKRFLAVKEAVDSSAVIENELYSQGRSENSVSEPADCAFTCIPVKSSCGVEGAILIFAKRRKGLTKSELGLLFNVSEHVGTTLENIKLKETLTEREKLLKIMTSELMSAYEKEKRELAGMLDDCLNPILIDFSLKLDALLSELGDSGKALSAEVAEYINHLKSTFGLLKMRLHPSLLDDFGLVKALEWYFERLEEDEKNSVKMLVVGEERRLSEEIEKSIFELIKKRINKYINESGSLPISLNLEFSENALYLKLIFSKTSESDNRDTSGCNAFDWEFMALKERLEVLGGNVSATDGKSDRDMIDLIIPYG